MARENNVIINNGLTFHHSNFYSLQNQNGRHKMMFYPIICDIVNDADEIVYDHIFPRCSNQMQELVAIDCIKCQQDNLS